MAKRGHRIEQIIAKLREIEVLIGQGRKVPEEASEDEYVSV